MSVVNTVLGPLKSDQLGCCLMHEHLLSSAGGIPENYRDIFGEGYKDRVIGKIQEAKKAGINTIVDATTVDLGRDMNFIKEVSHVTGMNIIAVTGWWLETPRMLERVHSEQWAQLFIKEIREGIAGTGAKPALLKAASDLGGVTPRNEVILRAVARAHLETSVPIMLHTYSLGQVARQQIAILKEEGVNLNRVKVDHSNDTTDVEYLCWLADQGCYLGLDRYPGRNTSSKARTRTLKALIDAGYAQRLLVSHDWPLVEPTAKNLGESEKARDSRNPHGLLFIKKVVLPMLLEMGVSQTVIDGIFIDNPRRFFDGG
jgi:phosphotriesterase-related protein